MPSLMLLGPLKKPVSHQPLIRAKGYRMSRLNRLDSIVQKGMGFLQWTPT